MNKIKIFDVVTCLQTNKKYSKFKFTHECSEVEAFFEWQNHISSRLSSISARNPLKEQSCQILTENGRSDLHCAR